MWFSMSFGAILVVAMSHLSQEEETVTVPEKLVESLGNGSYCPHSGLRWIKLKSTDPHHIGDNVTDQMNRESSSYTHECSKMCVKETQMMNNNTPCLSPYTPVDEMTEEKIYLCVLGSCQGGHCVIVGPNVTCWQPHEEVEYQEVSSDEEDYDD
uniref:Evasin n=1 Tax=Rhipicephalus zambeziensis TaxID=60191 RepID=A0A224YGV4_9ACAR